MMVFDPLPLLAAAGFAAAGSAKELVSSSERARSFGRSCNVTETIMDGPARVGVRGSYLSVRWGGAALTSLMRRGTDAARALDFANEQLMDIYILSF